MLNQTYQTIVSLGDWCGVAHNLRRHFRTAQAFPLDWWVVRWTGICRLLDEDFAHILQAENLVLDDELGVLCRHYGIGHPHEFQRDSAGAVVPELEQQLPVLREKFQALIARMDKAAADAGSRGEPILAVRHRVSEGETIDPGEALARGIALHARLASRWAGTDVDLLVVDSGAAAQMVDQKGGRISFDDLGPGMEPGQWRPLAWDAMLQRQGLRQKKARVVLPATC